MIWLRVDNRLVHGQIIETWLPYLGAKLLFVINDTIAQDILQQQIMQLAIPTKVAVKYLSVVQGVEALKQHENTLSSLFLVANCQDAQILVEQGGKVRSVNIGNLHYAPGKKQICTHVALSEEDATSLSSLVSKGIDLDFRCVPNDIPEVKQWN